MPSPAGHGKDTGIYPKGDGFEQGIFKRLLWLLCGKQTIGGQDGSLETSWRLLELSWGELILAWPTIVIVQHD